MVYNFSRRTNSAPRAGAAAVFLFCDCLDGDVFMGKKIKIGILLVGIAAIVFLSVRFFILFIPQKAKPIDPEQGLAYLTSLEAEDLSSREAAVAERQSEAPQTALPTEQGTSDLTQAPTQPHHVIEDGNFRKAFGDIVIAGDSLVKAIWEYNILDADQVIAEIGAGVGYLYDTLDAIVAQAPAYLILHYGENELDVPENADGFIARYAEAVRTLQQRLPQTVIFVDSIFPVEDFACESEPYLRYVSFYNEKLRQMATDLGVTYLDFTALWQTFDKDYYDGDGIHPTKSFYTEQYLPYLISEVNKK